MRPQNGKRGRSRGRKGGGGGHNNLNRTLESNGPDVKIRGSAAHIHEKYLSLARDAHSSGDRVGAENYLQHAEHYHRLMMAALPPGQSLPYGQSQQGHYNGNSESGEGEEADAGPETGEALPPQYQPQRRDEGQGQQYREPRDQGGYREQREYREPREFREPREREGQQREYQQRDGQPRGEPREVRESGQQPREPRGDRLNGRSRRVIDERGNGGPITTLDPQDKAAPVPPHPAPLDEGPEDDTDEVLA
jgi:Domain of unknown function (DUF4167)